MMPAEVAAANSAHCGLPEPAAAGTCHHHLLGTWPEKINANYIIIYRDHKQKERERYVLIVTR